MGGLRRLDPVGHHAQEMVDQRATGVGRAGAAARLHLFKVSLMERRLMGGFGIGIAIGIATVGRALLIPVSLAARSPAFPRAESAKADKVAPATPGNPAPVLAQPMPLGGGAPHGQPVDLHQGRPTFVIYARGMGPGTEAGQGGAVDKRWHFSIWYFLIGFMVLVLLRDIVIARHVVDIPYSTFKQGLNAGAVKEVVLQSTTITGQIKTAFIKKAAPRITFRDDAGAEWHSFATIRVADADLVKTLDSQQIDYAGVLESTFLQNLLSWLLPLGLMVLFWWFLLGRMGQSPGMMSIGKSKARIYVDKDIKVSFKDVAGIDEAVEELREVVAFLTAPERYTKLGGRLPKGVLLVGPPGTGKTLLARAVAGEAKVPFFSLSGSEFVEMFVGVGAARVRDLFEQAQRTAPCIIFIDELDALGKARGISAIGSNEEREQTLNQLLTEMDGFDPNRGVVLMAATNRPEILDPALLRAGRFDRHVVVDRPDVKGRLEILRIHTQRVVLGSNVDLDVVAARTPGFVGADLENIVNEAALLAARGGKADVTMQDFEEAIDRVLGGLQKKSSLMTTEEKRRVAHHESGHALVAMLVPHADPVHKVSIIPRGIAALGYTLQLPIEDRHLYTEAELLDRIAVLLGGRAAEEIVFGDLSTGAADDLKRATELASRLVREYGMSKALGPMTISLERPLFLGQVTEGSANCSEETQKLVDHEVMSILNAAYLRVTMLLRSRETVLREMASVLEVKESIDGETARALLGS